MESIKNSGKILISALIIHLGVFTNWVQSAENSLTDVPDAFPDYPDIRNIVICQEAEVSAHVPGLVIKEISYQPSPEALPIFAYELYESKDSDDLLFILECPDLKSGIVDSTWADWPEDIAFRGLTWISTQNPKVAGPEGSIIGKSKYKELKHLNWDNHDAPYEFRGCRRSKKGIHCAGKWVWMSFEFPSNLALEGNGITPEMEEQAVLSKVAMMNIPLTLDRLPENVQAYLNQKGN